MSIAKFGKKCGKELGKTLAICAVLAAAFLTVSASAESKARIVRLSEVEARCNSTAPPETVLTKRSSTCP